MSLEPKKMKVGELREALEARGLGTSGLKTELIHRLEMALDEEEFGVSAAPETAAPTQAAEPAAAEPAAAEPAAAEPAAAEAPAGAEKSSPAAEEKSKEGDSAGVPAAAADMSDIEKKKLERAKRFGIPIVEAKEETPGAAKEAKGKKGRSKPEADPELVRKLLLPSPFLHVRDSQLYFAFSRSGGEKASSHGSFRRREIGPVCRGDRQASRARQEICHRRGRQEGSPCSTVPGSFLNANRVNAFGCRLPQSALPLLLSSRACVEMPTRELSCARRALHVRVLEKRE